MKKIIIIALVICISIILVCTHYFSKQKKNNVAILTFHNVENHLKDKDSVDISTKKFEKYIKWLKENNYQSLSMDEFYQWKQGKKEIPQKSILITFDDGWKSFYTNAIPILEKYDMKATVFVIWKYTGDNEFYMNLDEINDIKKNYKNITLASHSYNLHIRENAESKNYDIYSDDMKYVNENYKQSSKYYAYPFGVRNKEYIKALKDNKYRLSFTFGPYDFATKNNDNYQIPRLGIFESTQDWKFKLKMFLEI